MAVYIELFLIFVVLLGNTIMLLFAMEVRGSTGLRRCAVTLLRFGVAATTTAAAYAFYGLFAGKVNFSIHEQLMITALAIKTVGVFVFHFGVLASERRKVNT